MKLRIVTWNVNGLRAILRKDFLDWLKTDRPDIVCLQEVRAGLKDLRPLESEFPDYRTLWHPADRPGYAGVAVLTRHEPAGFELGLNGGADIEGRALTVDFGTFRVASLYGPNATPGTAKMPIKSAWLGELRIHASRLDDRPLIVCGDLNVAHRAIDSQGERHPSGFNGCTDEEREGFQKLLDDCRLCDPIREASGDEILSTWWSVADRRRRRANGLRLDYALLPAAHRGLVKDSLIHPEVFGSDHCPVSLTVEMPGADLKKAAQVGQKRLL